MYKKFRNHLLPDCLLEPSIMHYRFISTSLLNARENNTVVKKIYLSNTTLTCKTDKKTDNNSDMDHINLLITATLDIRSKITEHTLTVVIIILPVVLHIFSMLKYGNPY